MAGESPDKSERERSSGETTQHTGSVPAARQQDPRSASAADAASADDTSTHDTSTGEMAADESSADDGSEGARGASGGGGQVSGAEAEGDAGDARLRAAVAAWVSRAEAEPEEAADEGESGSADTPGSEEGAGTGASSDLPVRPRGSAAKSPTAETAGAADSSDRTPSADPPTTMFGVRPDVDESVDKDSAAARAERMTAAFFGSSRKPKPADAGSDASGEASADDEGDSAEDEVASGAGASGGDASAAEVSSGDEVALGEPGGSGSGDAASPSPADAGSDASGEASADDEGDAASGGGASSADRDEAVGDEAASGGSESAEREDAASAEAASGGDASDARASSGDEVAPGEPGEPGGSGSGDAASPSSTDAGSDASGEVRADGDRDAGSDGSGEASSCPEGENPGGEEAATDAEPAKARTATGAKDQPTTAVRVPKGRQKEPARESAQEPAQEPAVEPVKEDGEGRGASRFVPLRDADEPRTPAAPDGMRQPLPDAATTGNETPASVITGVGGEQERTKQQPVPDPPPLELLAQLTNTPPPPETPLRTLLRRVKIWTPLVVLVAIVFAIVQAVRPLPEPTLTLTTEATHTFDGGKPSLPWPAEGQAYVEVSGLGVLGSSGEQTPVPIGSVAKTMTAYLVLQKHPLKEGEDGPKITVDKKAEKGGERGAGNGDESVLPSVEAGDKISERDALSALMIPSANNIARLLARWHSGSEAAFVEKMNETAKELGMENTTYTDPSGLKESTVSTAADQVALGKKAMEIPALVEITKQPYWVDPFSGDRMRNWNDLVGVNGAIGIKTGTTTAAGGNLLFADYKDVGDTRQLIVGAVLGQHKAPIIDTANAVSRELLDASGETLTSETVVKKGDVVGHVDDGLGGRTPVVATEDVRAVGWGGVEVELALEADEEMAHSAPAGRQVGVLTVGGGPGQVEVPVALQDDLTEPGFGDKLTRIL